MHSQGIYAPVHSCMCVYGPLTGQLGCLVPELKVILQLNPQVNALQVQAGTRL